MAKTKILNMQKKSLPDTLKKFSPDQKLLKDKKLIKEVLMDSLMENDLETFRDVLIAHIKTMSKTELAQKTGLGRRTLYDLMDEKKFDPRLSTIGALLSKLAS